MAAVGGLAFLSGIGLVAVAVVSRRERLPRNRLVGLRIPSTYRSDPAWKAGNRAAAPYFAIGGAAICGGGLLTATVARSEDEAATVLAVAGAAVVALAVAGAIAGHRAARRVG